MQMLTCSSAEQFSQRVANFLAASGNFPNRIDYSYPQQCQKSKLMLLPDVDVTKFPVIRSWPGEAGRYFTLALVVTRHIETNVENVGLYRAQVISPREIALNFASGSGADHHLQIARKRGEVLPVALVLGSDPAHLWAAAAPLPAGINEFDACCKLFGSSMTMVPAVSQSLQVPADSEVIIEGQIDPQKTCIEGPFGNHTGQYVTRTDCPLMQVTAIQQRTDPIIPMTVVGPPPSENIYLGKANEILIRETLKLNFSQIVDINMPVQTIFHGASLISIRSPNQKQNQEMINQLWASGPLRKARFILLVDEDIDLASLSQCWWRAINQLSRTKMYQSEGRMAIDATGVDPDSLVAENQEIVDLLGKRSNEYNL